MAVNRWGIWWGTTWGNDEQGLRPHEREKSQTVGTMEGEERKIRESREEEEE